jgi:hypothetical protein
MNNPNLFKKLYSPQGDSISLAVVSQPSIAAVDAYHVHLQVSFLLRYQNPVVGVNC